MLFKCSHTVRIPLMAAALGAFMAAGSAHAELVPDLLSPGLSKHPLTVKGPTKRPALRWTHTTQEEVPDDPRHMVWIPKMDPTPAANDATPSLTLQSLPDELAAELKSATGVGGNQSSMTTSPVPGPSALPLLALGALGLLGRRRD